MLARVPGVRLVSWNCAGGFRTKSKFQTLIDKTNFDVAIVAECSPLSDAELRAAPRGVSQVVDKPVRDERHKKHLGVFARGDWRVERAQTWDALPWLVHARVEGPMVFDVLAVWALGPEYANGLGYAEQTRGVVEQVLHQLPRDRPVVLAGDLNTPIPSSRADAGVHRENVRAMRKLDMLSAFSAKFPGAEPLSQPTHYWRWKQDRGFHIDHVFLPLSWCDRKDYSARVGTFEDWVAARVSDHVPVIVDVPRRVAPRMEWQDALPEHER